MSLKSLKGIVIRHIVSFELVDRQFVVIVLRSYNLPSFLFADGFWLVVRYPKCTLVEVGSAVVPS